MKKLFTTLFVLFTVVAFAQTNIEMQVEKEGDAEQYKLKLERTVDGEKVVTEKTYGSIEEMKNDPDLQDVDIHFFDGSSNDFSFTDEDSEKHIRVEIESEQEEGDGKPHTYTYFSDEDEEGDVDVNVWTDKDGSTHVLKNGKEVEIEEIKHEGDNVFVVKTDGGAIEEEEEMEVQVTVDDNGEHHVTVNGEEVNYKEWKEEHDGDLHVGSGTFVVKGGDGNSKHITKEIIIKKDGEEAGDGEMHVIIEKSSDWEVHVEDLTKEDEKAFSLENSKELNLDEFNFYPNPNEGQFKLGFKGKGKPTEVRVTDIHGKEVYKEELKNFSGVYDKEIDLSGTKKGIYLLQVIQGAKATNKKIVIE